MPAGGADGFVTKLPPAGVLTRIKILPYKETSTTQKFFFVAGAQTPLTTMDPVIRERRPNVIRSERRPNAIRSERRPNVILSERR